METELIQVTEVDDILVEPMAHSATLQRLWSTRRLTPCLEESLLTEVFPPVQEDDELTPKTPLCDRSLPSTPRCHTPCHFDESDWEADAWKETFLGDHESSPRPLEVRGSDVGDIPASYVVPRPRPHEMPVVGVYVDPRVVPGFRYRVRCLGSDKHLFSGRALTLLSIGRGYGKRFTFESHQLNHNENYFWSDSNPEGYGFELEAVAPGEKFTIYDANHLSVGTLEIVECKVPQVETRHEVLPDGTVKKFVRLRLLGKVEWFETGATQAVPVSGLAVAEKTRKARSAVVNKVINVMVGHQRGFTLIPGVDKCRRTTVHGSRINDVPTQYTVIGLEPHEIPVVGTYVDPRIAVGFHYRVRPAQSKKHFFEGCALQLTSIGRGYGKRLTFESDKLNEPENYFWSDSNPDGFGFEPRAVFAGMKFQVQVGDLEVGEATVFRADSSQQEESSEITADGTLVKRIHVDVTCHVQFNNNKDLQTMRVSGTAIVRRVRGSNVAKLQRIENIGLASQLNLLFFNQEANVVFHPM